MKTKVDVSSEGDAFVLKSAIMLYERYANSMVATSYHSDGYATIHAVSRDGTSGVIEAGRPMTNTDYRRLIHALAPKEQPQMLWQDDSILARGMGRMIWWTPAMKRPMFFKASGLARNTVDAEAVCPVPPMVWMSTQNSLYVYALKENMTPKQSTRLYQAPFFNIWGRGQVCTGSAKLPADDRKGEPKEWEKFLFGSNFTHPNFTQKDRLVKGVEPVKFWKAMLKKPTATFPVDRLVELPLTVADLMPTDFQVKLNPLRPTGEF